MNLEEGRTPDSLLGRVIAGRYRIDASLGHGASGPLYRAAQQPLERVVALRVLPAAARGRDVGDRFAGEAQIAGRLTHPNTVRLIDFGRTEDGAPFLAMEYLSGRSLQALLAEGPVEETRAVHIAQQICRSLREAHGLGVVHRGLRPSSVMLLRQQDEQDFVKLMDFGLPPLASAAQLALMPAEAVRYFAPEQVRNQQADARTDIYALGALLYEMLTGRPPFAGTTATEVVVRHLAEAPQPPRSVRPDLGIDDALERIVLRCLQKDRAARFGSTDELLEQLKAVRARLTHTMLTTSLPPMHRDLTPALPTPMASTPVRGMRRLPPSKPERPRFEAMANSLQPRRRLRIALGLVVMAAAGALVVSALRSEPAQVEVGPVPARVQPLRAAQQTFGGGK